MINQKSVDQPLEPAQYVICANCGNVLAFIHLFNGVSLLMIDVATENATKNPINVSLAFLFIVCSILSFISTRRLDRFALKILLFFALAALVSSSYLFGENGLFLNKVCMNENNCTKVQQMTHSQLAMLGLIELATSIATLVFGYRALCSEQKMSNSGYNYNHLVVDEESSNFSNPKIETTNLEKKENLEIEDEKRELSS